MIIGHIGLIGPIEIIKKKNPAVTQPGFSFIPFFSIMSFPPSHRGVGPYGPYGPEADFPIPNRHAAFVSFTAQTLYSGMPEMGSRAAFVRRLAAAKA